MANQQQPPQGGYPMQQPPAFNLPDNEASSNSYREDRERGGGGGTKIPFVRFPGPQGQRKWEGRDVPVGWKVSLRLFILPPWAPGKNIYAVGNSHFWRSPQNPNGRNITCPGKATCGICQSRRAGFDHPNPEVQKRAKDFGKVSHVYLYNVVMLDNLQGHYIQVPSQQPGGQPGWVMRPFVLDARKALHDDMGRLFDAPGRGGVVSFVNPQMGREMWATKEKIGPEKINIKYWATDGQQMALPQEFWPVLQGLWDLENLYDPPTQEQMIQAVQEIYSVPQMAPAAPWANPYGPPAPGQQMPPGQQPWSPPGQTQVSQPPAQPAPGQPWQPPQQPGSPPSQPQPASMQGWQPPVAGQPGPGGPPPGWSPPPQAMTPPPGWSPPAVPSQPPPVQGGPVPPGWSPPGPPPAAMTPQQPPMAGQPGPGGPPPGWSPPPAPPAAGQLPSWVAPPGSDPQQLPLQGPPPASPPVLQPPAQPVPPYQPSALPPQAQPPLVPGWSPPPAPPAMPAQSAQPPATPVETPEQLQARLMAQAGQGK